MQDDNAPCERITKRSFPAMTGVLLSRASGIVRTIIINASFGANVLLDSFNTAFRFPNSLRDLFADGALSAAFMKTLVDEKAKGNLAEITLISIVSGFFLTITLLLALLGVIFAKPFISLLSNHHFMQEGGLTLASHLFQILAFYLPLTMLNAIIMAALGVHNMNFRAMNGSLFLSIGMVLGALVLAPLCLLFHYSGVYGLAWGALIGAFSQLIYQIIPLLRLKLIKLPCFNPITWYRYTPLKDILWMMCPRALGQGASTLALMINTFFALSLGQGAMTYVATTIIIIQVPIGLFGVATGFASLPVLTKAINQKDHRFSKLFVDSIDSTLWFALLTTAAFALMMVPAYNLIFQHGKIHFADTLLNCLTIAAYASGILFACGSKVLINGLYALNATRYIVYNSMVYLIVSGLLTALLTPILGLTGLGWAFGIGSFANFWLNYYLVYFAFKRRGLGKSPYESGGKYYLIKISSYSLLSFIIALTGVMLITHFWQYFPEIVGEPLTMLMSLGILSASGLLFLLISFALTWRLGPEVLQTYCKQLIELKRKKK